MQLKRHVIEAILWLIFEYSYFISKNLYKIVVTLLLKKQLMIVLDLAVWSPLYIWQNQKCEHMRYPISPDFYLGFENLLLFKIY